MSVSKEHEATPVSLLLGRRILYRHWQGSVPCPNLIVIFAEILSSFILHPSSLLPTPCPHPRNQHLSLSIISLPPTPVPRASSQLPKTRKQTQHPSASRLFSVTFLKTTISSDPRLQSRQRGLPVRQLPEISPSSGGKGLDRSGSWLDVLYHTLQALVRVYMRRKQHGRLRRRRDSSRDGTSAAVRTRLTLVTVHGLSQLGYLSEPEPYSERREIERRSCWAISNSCES